MQIVTDWENNIFEKNDNENERKYRVDKSNEKLKRHEEFDSYNINDNEKKNDKKDVKNNIAINNAKKIIKIFD